MKFNSSILLLPLATGFKSDLGRSYTVTDDVVDAKLCGNEKAKSLSGYLSVKGSEFDSKSDKELFYWMFESQEAPAEAPFVVWLTGGPGCSSTLALLSENGPCSVNKDGTGTLPNPNSWNAKANVLWLDQPAGVGFSYGSQNDKDQEMIAEDAYYFLQTFFEAHPEYSKNELFLFGESYGGHYAPAISNRIMQGNTEGKEGTQNLNLAGLGVGNGLTSPEIQYAYYPQMAYNNSHNIQTVDEKTYESMLAAVPKCQGMIKKCNEDDNQCSRAYTYCNQALTSPYYKSGLNPYDIRKECGDNPLCYDFTNVETWLTTQSTLDALHVTSASAKWQSCNTQINKQFKNDWMKRFDPFVKDLLEGGVRVMIYAGDVDFICNSLGNKAWTLGFDWSGKEAFNGAGDKDWNSGAGTIRQSGGLTFLEVSEAGHMVPSDQPVVALSMLNDFLANTLAA